MHTHMHYALELGFCLWYITVVIIFSLINNGSIAWSRSRLCSHDSENVRRHLQHHQYLHNRKLWFMDTFYLCINLQYKIQGDITVFMCVLPQSRHSLRWVSGFVSGVCVKSKLFYLYPHFSSSLCILLSSALSLFHFWYATISSSPLLSASLHYFRHSPSLLSLIFHPFFTDFLPVIFLVLYLLLLFPLPRFSSCLLNISTGWLSLRSSPWSSPRQFTITNTPGPQTTSTFRRGNESWDQTCRGSHESMCSFTEPLYDRVRIACSHNTGASGKVN